VEPVNTMLKKRIEKAQFSVITYFLFTTKNMTLILSIILFLIANFLFYQNFNENCYDNLTLYFSDQLKPLAYSSILDDMTSEQKLEYYHELEKTSDPFNPKNSPMSDEDVKIGITCLAIMYIFVYIFTSFK